MMAIISSQKETIKQYVLDCLKLDTKRTDIIDPIVKDGLSDLVRIQMREVAAAQRETELEWNTVIDTAIQQVLAVLTGRSSSESKVIEEYLALVKKELRYTAKEISQLQKEGLVHMLSGEASVWRAQKSSAFEVITLGSSNNIWGIWVSKLPSADVSNIDLKRIRSIADLIPNSSVEGDWFPFEIRIGEIDFVLDDDGSIYVSTENFPNQLVKSSYEGIQRIAETLYYD